MKSIIALLGVLAVLMMAGMYAVQARHDENAAMEPARVETNAANPVQALRENGHYRILVMALEDSGVASELLQPGERTFFAPTDEAFQKVPKLADLLHDDLRLKQVLRDHIVEGQALSYADMPDHAHLQTLGGRIVDVKSDGRNVDDARIDQPNITAGGVVIHGIDKVLMENNDSKLRQAGETLEEGVKFAGRKTYQGLKTGAQKIKDVFTDSSDTKVEITTQTQTTDSH